jgi:hypothetical protein
MSRLGAWINADATATFWRIPRERRLGQRVAPRRQLELFEQLARERLPVRDAVQPRREFEVLPHREPREQVRLVGHEPELALCRERVRREVDAVDGDRARVGLEDPRDAAQRRGLARAVRTDEPEHLARAHLEAHRVDGDAVFEALGQLPDHEHGRRP